MATTPSSQTHTAQTTIDLHRGLHEGLEMFDVIEDPRIGNATRHPFGSILFIALCALLCGMNTCEDFVRFAKAREDWLKKWISLPNGILRSNTFLRVFAAINPVSFSECLVEFVTHISPDLTGKQLLPLGIRRGVSRRRSPRPLRRRCPKSLKLTAHRPKFTQKRRPKNQRKPFEVNESMPPSIPLT
ncbi:MAG: transposase family protein [Akkermansiaceae bacterium]|nr:transposase family protein [Akkermansiaceae bacterium]